MSLINDMLKDLEARWPGRNDLAGTIAPADTGEPDVQDEGDPPPLRAQRAGAGKSGFLSNGRAIMIAVGVAAFVGVVLLERQTRPDAEPEAAAAAPREPVGATTPPPLQPSVPLPADTLETVAPIPPAPPEAAVDLPGTKASAPEAAAAEPATAVLLAPVPLGRLAAELGTPVAATDIGAIAFYGRQPVVDLVGIGHNGVARAMRDPKVIEALAEHGTRVKYLNRKNYRQYLADNYAEWEAIARGVGMYKR